MKKPQRIWETWDSILMKSMVLGHQIADAAQNMDDPIDRIAVVPRGGLFAVNVVARQLGMSGDEVLSLGISRYSREHPTKAGAFKVGQLPTEDDVKDRVIVLVEEVHDTGETAQYAKQALEELGAKKVYVAAVYHKPSKNVTGEHPDFALEETDAWIYHPWEIIDEIGDMHQRSVASSRD